MRSIFLFVVISVLSQTLLSAKDSKGEEEDEAPNGIRDPRPCEVCKYLAVELQGRLDETGKVRGYIETGHGLDPKRKKRKEYKRSELRLIEALQEPHVCNKILEYNVHAERKKSLRYAKGQSQTMEALHGLVDKGVKVELGIPYEMWDQPSAEITNMQRSCFTLVEEREDDIEEWYWGSQDKPLIDYLCRDRVLKGKDSGCLEEVFVPKEEKEDDDDGDDDDNDDNQTENETDLPAQKGDTGIPSTAMPPTQPPDSEDVRPIPPPAAEGEIKDEL